MGNQDGTAAVRGASSKLIKYEWNFGGCSCRDVLVEMVVSYCISKLVKI